MGNKRYEIEGTGIHVAWSVSQPQAVMKPSFANKAVVYLPGWGYNEQAKSVEQFCQKLADYSRMMTYALDTRTESVIPQSLLTEAWVDCQLIKEKGIDDITIVGHSQGGSQAIHLTRLLQNRIHVNGLILLDAVSLHDQFIGNIVINYIRELIRSILKNEPYIKEGIIETVRQIRLAGGIHRYLIRVWNELIEIHAINPSAQEVRVPVIIVHGAKDFISQPSKIIPDLEGRQRPSYIQDMNGREKYLQERLFPKSPSIKMLVVKKRGYHSLLALRPDEVARASLYLVERSLRTKNR